MKTRNSLVSNSSTSSFICLVPLDIHNRILNGLDFVHLDIVKKFLNGYTNSVNKFGIELRYLSQTNGNDTNPDPNEEAETILTEQERIILDESEGDGCYWEILDAYQSAVEAEEKINSTNVFTLTESY